MNILIDNKDLKTGYSIDVLDYSGVFSIAAERESSRVWQDKSGIEKLRTNPRYDTNEFVLTCMVKATTLLAAYALVKVLTDYMFSKGLFVLSLRETETSTRECYLCERSTSIVGDVNIRYQNSLYVFKLGLRDVNPQALKFKTSIVAHAASVSYTKGQISNIFWGDGSIGDVSNSGTLTKSDYVATTGLVDIIIDVDSNATTVGALVATFSANVTVGIIPEEVVFTSTSTGSIIIYAWDFGDGTTSSEQNPTHTYTTAGVFTVTLQVFNTSQGSAIETKTAYITITNSQLMINGTDFLLINANDKLLNN